MEKGHYPPEALKYRMAVKGLMQSDPHDARILKAFALGLAVATRGMDHLRNRVTLEINARINDDPAFKERLYGGPVSAAPNSYDDKERAVRRCENIYAVGDSGRHVPLHDEAVQQPVAARPRGVRRRRSPTSPAWSSRADELDRVGLNVMGVERLINSRLGVSREDDTLPDRWFDEPITVGAYKGEKIDRAEFDAMLSRFYAISNLTEEGVPIESWRNELHALLGGSERTRPTA